jgi:hypothetical protein
MSVGKTIQFAGKKNLKKPECGLKYSRWLGKFTRTEFLHHLYDDLVTFETKKSTLWGLASILKLPIADNLDNTLETPTKVSGITASVPKTNSLISRTSGNNIGLLWVPA